MTARPKIRCAIYTRKSSEEGLDQDFNSLDAQHEACAAYIASQRHEGWKPLPQRYDDGGLSGGTLDRPALQRLLAEVDAGRIDMVVVYKIDRLTRSLADFARLVERLEAAGCSFVSVTQAFNTSSSMGRLTLNVLLSFAQFEREVTAERIRDKIAASKKKGLWMGGNLPLGYDNHPDPKTRTLVINSTEAAIVRRIFDLYAELGCLRRVAESAAAEGLRSKRRLRADGRVTGDRPMSRGQIHFLLRNPVYLGRIRHKEKSWPGLHEAIIDGDLWKRVQDMLGAAARRSRRQGDASNGGKARDREAWLTAKLQDETGDRLTPTHTLRNGRRLRYYVSNRLISCGTDPTGWRLPGPALEKAIVNVVAAHLEHAATSHRILATPDASTAGTMAPRMRTLLDRIAGFDGALCGDLVNRGSLRRGRIEMELDASVLARELALAEKDLHPDLLHVTAAFDLRRRGVEARIVVGDIRPSPDPYLRAMLVRAHGWAHELRSGTGVSEIARREKVPDSYIRTRSQIAFLSPGIQSAILEGSQPPELTQKRLVSNTLPLDWAEQERLLGFREA
ncbi:recombinase family protein [Aliiruegeria lutimaris]|uniref:Site-specific DNA recombinase n=1 Tax=Aliiruegeria lutimaris TaxID=571298 RepID=A0A1G9DMU3_9RHOB|nr:recombinase family protein [Aliiruegeria lutimaris]SDK65208.1 Site-specific DNA recombinase [Aliiruegeria lutimaris]